MDYVTRIYHLTLWFLTGSPEALCSRAWRNKERLSSRMLIWLVGHKHCETSHGWWRERV